MTHSLLAVLLLACSTTSALQPPAKVFDFAPRELADFTSSTTGSRSPKQMLRGLVASVAPQLAACARTSSHPAGTLAVTLEIVVDDVEPGTVERVAIDAPSHAALADCMRPIFATMTIPVAMESATWVMHQPIIVQARQ